MYTRNYYSEDDKIIVPENYDGNAFSENQEANERETSQKPPVKEELPPLRAPWDISKEETKGGAEEVLATPKGREGFFGEFINKLPLGNLFRRGDFLKNTFSDFGTEELLIIGVALFLLISKDGDKECAFILLFLLFVK